MPYCRVWSTYYCILYKVFVAYQVVYNVAVLYTHSHMGTCLTAANGLTGTVGTLNFFVQYCTSL